MEESGWPSASTTPWDGCRSPAASFKVRVLPVPVSPRRTSVSRCCTRKDTPRRTSPSSNPMRTLSKVITGASVGSVAEELIDNRDYSGLWRLVCLENLPRPAIECCASKKFASQKEGELRQEQIGANNHHGGNHYGLRGGPAYTLRSTADGEALVAPNRRQDEPVHDGLHHPLHNVRKFQRVNGTRPKFHRIQAQRKD